ncbi:FAD-binding domain-containing protein [Imleria badia]|nr:FAD-binding domain-containing protein [Imleria badia]
MPGPLPNLALQNAIEKIQKIVMIAKADLSGNGYKASVTHYFNSSTEISACAVQPGSEEDLQKIIKAVAETRVKFAVKCGGHATNPGFSSTEGIQLHLVRLNKITVDAKNKLVRVGAGCLFEELYRALAPHNLNIVGGSGLAGVEVAGWMLGGGYSTKTSQYGLGVDNIAAAKLVLPNGRPQSSNRGERTGVVLRHQAIGGGDNFGIITEFTLEAHVQRKYYDFLVTYQPQHYPIVKEAISDFVKKTDNKANIEAAFRYRYHNNPSGIEKFLTVHCAYDGTYPSEDPFKELKAIEHTMDNYGDPLPSRKPVATPYFPFDPNTSIETSSFHVADTLRSMDNETYDFSEFPEDLLRNRNDEIKFNVLMVGQVLLITEFVGDGSPQHARVERPKQPMVGVSQYPRGRWGNVMVDEFTSSIIEEIEKQSNEASKDMEKHGGTRTGIGMWPLTKSMFDKATPSAWPHVQDKPNRPIIIYFTWEGKEHDDYWVRTMKSTLKTIRDKVHAERESSKGLPYFISTALADPEATSVEDLYSGNLEKLKQLRKKYDPKGVMDLTGGFKIPLPPTGHSASAGEE